MVGNSDNKHQSAVRARGQCTVWDFKNNTPTAASWVGHCGKVWAGTQTFLEIIFSAQNVTLYFSQMSIFDVLIWHSILCVNVYVLYIDHFVD